MKKLKILGNKEQLNKRIYSSFYFQIIRVHMPLQEQEEARLTMLKHPLEQKVDRPLVVEQNLVVE